MTNIKITLLAFVLASILDIIGIVFSIPILVYIFKPLIILSLLFLYVFSLPKRLKWYVMALELCFFGDVFLMYSGQLPFKIGLISFLIAHILFIKIVIHRIKKVSFLSILTAIIPFAVFLSALIFTIKDFLGELFIPVIIYGFTISMFGVVSLINYVETKSTKSIWMLIGAIVFMISDALLAINKFYNPAHVLEVIVMVTYVLAQYFIFRSMVQENAL